MRRRYEWELSLNHESKESVHKTRASCIMAGIFIAAIDGAIRLISEFISNRVWLT